MANLFSQLKQWSARLKESLTQPPRRSSQLSSQRKQSIRTQGALSKSRSKTGQTNEEAAFQKRLEARKSKTARRAEPSSNIALGNTLSASTRPRLAHQRFRFWLLLLVAAGIAGPSARLYQLWEDVNETIPDVRRALTFERSGTITLKAGDGKILQKVGPTAQENLTFDEIPNVVSQAFIAAEDRRFYEHDGVDYRSIGRAVWANLSSGSVVEGASTITQQLARITFLNLDQSFERKFKRSDPSSPTGKRAGQR